MAYIPCKHLDVKPGERITMHSINRCLCPLPDMPVLPVSLTNSHGWRPWSNKWKVSVQKDDCAKCPLFEVRK